MGYKFVLQGAENSYVQCPNGLKIPLLKKGRLYWLKWEKAVERRKVVKPKRPAKTKPSDCMEVNQASLSSESEEGVADVDADMMQDDEAELRRGATVVEAPSQATVIFCMIITMFYLIPSSTIPTILLQPLLQLSTKLNFSSINRIVLLLIKLMTSGHVVCVVVVETKFVKRMVTLCRAIG